MYGWVFSCLLSGILMLSGSTADVILDSCLSEDYCAGQSITYNCVADSGNIRILLKDTNGQPVLDRRFNETSTIGDNQTVTAGPISLWYNQTSNTTVRVWFTAHQSINGFTFECRDIEDEKNIEVTNCSISINSALPVPVSFDIDDPKYCDAATFTWNISGDTTCLKEIVLQRVNSGGNDTNVPLNSSTRSYTISNATIGKTQNCLSVASRNYEKTSMFSADRCVAFDVPFAPTVQNNYTLDQSASDVDVMVTIRWMVPFSQTRPYVKWFYITANITSADDDASGSGTNDDNGKMMMNEFETDRVSGNVMVFLGAREGSTYTFKITAENCFGNSTETEYTFTVKQQVVTPTTTSTMGSTATETPSPSSSPTMGEDDAALATYIIIIIAVVGAFVLAVFIAVIIAVICCCVCTGGIICCAVGASSKKEPRIELADKGTRL